MIDGMQTANYGILNLGDLYNKGKLRIYNTAFNPVENSGYIQNVQHIAFGKDPEPATTVLAVSN